MPPLASAAGVPVIVWFEFSVSPSGRPIALKDIPVVSLLVVEAVIRRGETATPTCTTCGPPITFTVTAPAPRARPPYWTLVTVAVVPGTEPATAWTQASEAVVEEAPAAL